MTRAVAAPGSDQASVRAEVAQRLWVLIVAGVPTGVIVAGLGSRLAMFVLRLTSPDSVVGVESDDGFEIGRFTLSGTYNLMALGAVVGLIGVAAYRFVSPWLVGPLWFRRATVAGGCAAVVGSMLVHDDGIDFHVLTPQWLAIGLFVALPGAFGLVIGVVVDRLKDRPLAQGRRPWVLPIVLVAAFPPALVGALIGVVALVLWAPIRRGLQPVFRDAPGLAIFVRAAWLSIAVLGLLALIGDIRALR